MEVHNRTLLWILAAAPIGGLIALLDHYLLAETLKKAMDIPIADIFTITAILTFPHIMASLIGFADPEYAKFYKKPLIKGIALSLGIAIGCKLFLDGPFILFLVAFYSIYHNIMQQFGIAAMMLKQKQTWGYTFMKWSLVIPSGLAFTAIMFAFIPEIAELREPFLHLEAVFLLAATLLAIAYYFRIRKRTELPKIGLQYFVGNIVWMYISYFLIVADYGLMAIILSRVIHDCTAYWIYMIHDQNRNGTQNHNFFYKLPQKLGLRPFWLLIPLAAMLSSIIFAIYDHIDLMAVIITAFNIMHFYIEGHVWKRGTLHRQHVPFV